MSQYDRQFGGWLPEDRKQQPGESHVCSCQNPAAFRHAIGGRWCMLCNKPCPLKQSEVDPKKDPTGA